MIDLIRAVFDDEYGIPFDTATQDMDSAACDAIQNILMGRVWHECRCIEFITAPQAEHWTCPDCDDKYGWWS